MSVSAVVKNGELVETASQKSVSAAASTSSTEKTAPQGYDKDSFLQLLVAQMKYQDPLEPTSNTEYISQYATFSQVEQLQNMASTMELSRASGYVGKVVQISSTDTKGETEIVEGKVDYIKYENNKAYVSIGGELYSADNITAVIDTDYSDAAELADAFATAVNSLPNLDDISIADAKNVKQLVATYEAMSPFQQSFLDDSYAEVLKKYFEKITELEAAARTEEDAKKETNEESKETSEGSETNSSAEATEV